LAFIVRIHHDARSSECQTRGKELHSLITEPVASQTYLGTGVNTSVKSTVV